MNVIIALPCGPADVGHITATIKSIQDGNIKPYEIVVTMYGGAKVPSALKKRVMAKGSRIYINSTSLNDPNVYGSLAAVYGTLKRYNSVNDTYIVLCNPRCTYPPNLLQEYASNVDNINRSLKEKLPDSNGSIFGFGGVVMAQNKNLNLEREFKQLIGEADDMEQHEERNIVGYVRETATVDFLESCGSILMRRSQLQEDFLDYLNATLLDETVSSDIVLSNYFAKHNVLRTQICSLSLNRFMLHSCGYQKSYDELPASDKQVLFERTVIHLRSKGVFYAYT